MSLFTNQFAHWHQSFENASLSPTQFYGGLQQAITERKLPSVEASRHDILERGLLSPKRTYLHIKRDWVTYAICAAPFGSGFFVSSRLLVNTWRSWPVLFIPGAIAALAPILVFGLIVLLLHSVPAAFFLSMFVFFIGIMGFLLFGLLWLLRRRITYWRLDSMMAFHDAVHSLLIEKINETIQTSGLKPLSAEECKPVLHKLLQR